MDIDIQTILQQDIDLGIKKSYEYEYESSGTSGSGTATATPMPTSSSPVGYELFNKYLGAGAVGGTDATGEMGLASLKRGGEFHHHQQADFYMRPTQLDSESQKVIKKS